MAFESLKKQLGEIKNAYQDLDTQYGLRMHDNDYMSEFAKSNVQEVLQPEEVKKSEQQVTDVATVASEPEVSQSSTTTKEQMSNATTVLQPEILWGFMTDKEALTQFQKDPFYSFYKSVVDFGLLCANSYGSSFVVFQDFSLFADVYNGLLKAIMAKIEAGESQYMTLRELYQIALVITPRNVDKDVYMAGLNAVFETDNIMNLVDVETRKQIVGKFASWIQRFYNEQITIQYDPTKTTPSRR